MQFLLPHLPHLRRLVLVPPDVAIWASRIDSFTNCWRIFFMSSLAISCESHSNQESHLKLQLVISIFFAASNFIVIIWFWHGTCGNYRFQKKTQNRNYTTTPLQMWDNSGGQKAASIHVMYYNHCCKSLLTSEVMVAILDGDTCPLMTFCLREGFFRSPRFDTRLLIFILYLFPVSLNSDWIRETRSRRIKEHTTTSSIHTPPPLHIHYNISFSI